MISCKELVERLSSDAETSFLRGMELRFHLLMCAYCARYAAHLKILRGAMQKLFFAKSQAFADRVAALEQAVLKQISR